MSSWNPFSYPPRAVLKTIYGFLLPGVVVIGAAFARAAADSHKPVSKFDVIAALVAMFVTGGAVFGATNTPPGETTPQEAQRDGGYATLHLALLVIGLVLIAVGLLGLLHILAIALSICIILVVIGLLLVVGAQFGGTLP